MEYYTTYKTRFGSTYILLPKDELWRITGYDGLVAQNHIANVGCIITYDGDEPIDDEYELDVIYARIEEEGIG